MNMENIQRALGIIDGCIFVANDDIAAALSSAIEILDEELGGDKKYGNPKNH